MKKTTLYKAIITAICLVLLSATAMSCADIAYISSDDGGAGAIDAVETEAATDTTVETDAETEAAVIQPALVETEPIEEDDEFSDLYGEYYDKTSGRASATIIKTEEGNLSMVVRWANSAFEAGVWTMTIEKTDDRLVYSDCDYTVTTYTDDGEVATSNTETVYTDGEGYFTITEEGLLWNGAIDENCNTCLFEKNISYTEEDTVL